MQIHLVSFNIPYPADYGGVIDVFYKIKALHSAGVKIRLHCFAYGRKPANQLLDYCQDVSYYNRSLNPIHHLSSLPFIVKTRKNRQLFDAIQSDKNPILFEGLHCTAPLISKEFNGKRALVRTHNVEHEYYRGLAKSEGSITKKLYYQIEVKKLKNYEPILKKAGAIAAISASEKNHFSKYNPNTQLITPFHPFDEVEVKPGKGRYILVHGDLSVAENIQSVEWIIKNIVPSCPYRFTIAGKNPSSSIVEMVKAHSNIDLVANPDDRTMAQLVENAHINLIHSFYPQGFKLKLLYALHKGRFCLCNPSVISNTGLYTLCQTASNARQFIEKVNVLMGIDFDEREISSRKELLSPFSNAEQAAKILKMIEGLNIY